MVICSITCHSQSSSQDNKNACKTRMKIAADRDSAVKDETQLCGQLENRCNVGARVPLRASVHALLCGWGVGGWEGAGRMGKIE